ncbi:MAG: 4-hydroxy-tetrahydrodipicolinate synthase [Promethearchaeota archaeon]
MNFNDIKGSFVAIITPMNDNLEVDFEEFKKLINFHLENGTNGLVPCGTTGESATMSHEEHRRVMDFFMKYVRENAPKFNRTIGEDLFIIPGSGSNSTMEAIELTKYAQKAGAHAALVISPYYNKPTQQGIKKHFKMIADEVDIPIVVYNVPGRTGKNVEPDTTIELSKIDNIVAIKEASGNMNQIMKIIQKTRDSEFAVMSGDDGLTLPIIAAGGKGVISVAANVVPKLMVEFTSAALNGDMKTAVNLHYKLLDLFDVEFIETNPGPIKYMAGRIGLPAGDVRPPLVLPEPTSRQKIDAVLQSLGLIS